MTTRNSFLTCAAALAAAAVLAVPGVAQPPGAAEALPPRFGIPPNELKLTMSAAELPNERYDWGVQALGADKAHVKGITGKGVVVTVLDTGVQADHNDLKPVDSFTDATGNGLRDVQGHGTHCSGSIGSRVNNVGFVGVAPECVLRHVKVLGDSGSGGVDDIAAGIRQATAAGTDVQSMSLGGDSPDGYIPPALLEAEAAGVIVCIAAGNEGRSNGVSYPGRYKGCFCVAAVDANLNRAAFSNGGPEVIVSGPGVNIRSTYPGNQYATMSGTSMATPHIAGVAALWISCNPTLPKKERPAAFRKWLSENCKDLGSPGRDNLTGYGLPDCTRLSVSSVTPPPVVPPVPGVPAAPVVLTVDDLTPAARVRLGLAGYADFSLSLTPKPAAAPMPAAPPVEMDTPSNIGPASRKPTAVPQTIPPAGKRWVKRGTLADDTPWELEDAAPFQPANFQFQTIRRAMGACPGGVCPVR